jgi:hypothetical protein
MRDHLRQRRIEDEVYLLALQYREVNYDDKHGHWVMIPRFPLPAGLGRLSCALLIEVPQSYPTVPPRGVYLDRDLDIGEHFFADPGHLNHYADKGWAWLCLHEADGQHSSWRPGQHAASGDNLLVMLLLVHAMLDELCDT